MVSQYYCSKQHDLLQFIWTPEKTCCQTPTSLESTRAFAKNFVRAKAKCLKAWTCGAYVKREKFVCAQSDYNYPRHDRTNYHQSTVKRPGTSDPTEGKLAFDYLNGTDNPQLNAFDYSNSFTFFHDVQKHCLLENNNLLFVSLIETISTIVFLLG